MAQEYKGKPVFKGIALGPVTVLKKQDVQVKREKAGDPESEIKKVEEAVETSKEQLQHLYEKALSEVGEASAAIFEVHQMMLEDEDYQDAIRNMIRDNKIPQIDGMIYSSATPELVSMDASLLKLYKDGTISKDTALTYATNPEMLKRRL